MTGPEHPQEGQVEEVDEDSDPETIADLWKAMFLSWMETMKGKLVGESSSAYASTVPLKESDFTDLSDIKNFSDDEAEWILDFANTENNDKKLAEEVIRSTMTLAKDDIVKHYSEFFLTEYMLQITSEFLTYVRIRGTEYGKITRALKVYEEDTLIDGEVKMLHKFWVANFGDIIDGDEVWRRIDRIISFEHSEVLQQEPSLSNDEAEQNWNAKVEIMKADSAKLKKMKAEIAEL